MSLHSVETLFSFPLYGFVTPTFVSRIQAEITTTTKGIQIHSSKVKVTLGGQTNTFIYLPNNFVINV